MSIFDDIGNAFSAAGDFLGDVAEGAMDFLATGAEYVGKTVSKTVEFAGDLTSTAFHTAGKVFNGFISATGDALGGTVKFIGNGLQNIGNFTMDVLGGAVNVLGKTTSGILNTLGKAGSSFINVIGNGFNAVGGFLSGAVNFVGNAFGGLTKFAGNILKGAIDFGGDLLKGGLGILGGIGNFAMGLLEDGLNFVAGRSPLEHEVYVNYDKVELVCDTLNSIAKKGMGDAQDAIYEAIDRLNNVKGFKDYVGYVDKSKYDQIIDAMSDVISGIATVIEEKAQAIKEYEESGFFEKVGSTATMVLAKSFEGMASILESIGDGAIYIAGWTAGNVFNEKGFQNACKTLIEKDISHDMLGFYYNSDFAKASFIKEDSIAAGAFKLLGKGYSMMAVGPAGIIKSGFGKGVEGALRNGVEYNDAFGHGLVTAAAQGIMGNVLLGGFGLAGKAIASGSGDLVARMAKPSNKSQTVEEGSEEDSGETEGSTGGSTNTQNNNSSTGQVQYRTENTSGGGGGVKQKVIKDIDPIVPDKPEPQTNPEPKTDPVPDTKPEPTTDPEPDTKPEPITDPEPDPITDPEPDPIIINVPGPNQPYPPYPTSPAPTPDPEPIVNVDDDILENSDILADLDTLGFDTNLDEIVRGNRYTKIPVSTSPVQARKTTGSNGVVPIAAGLSVAAAAGLGAKAYMDYKKNNSDLDDEFDSEDELDNEEEQDDFDNDTENWSETENVEIEETERDRELRENMSDYYQNDSVYTARDVLEEI